MCLLGRRKETCDSDIGCWEFCPLGRYETEFIEHRRAMLESWVQRVCRHPVLARSEVWRHFVSCTDEKAWKVGKRKAERDDLVGAKLFLAVDAPESPLSSDSVYVNCTLFPPLL